MQIQNPISPPTCQLFGRGTWGGQSGARGDPGTPLSAPLNLRHFWGAIYLKLRPDSSKFKSFRGAINLKWGPDTSESQGADATIFLFLVSVCKLENYNL